MDNSNITKIPIELPELRQLPGLITAGQVASILKCSKRHILRECHAGQLAFISIAGRFLITPNSIEKYLNERIIQCQNETEAPISNGLKRGNHGTSFGLKVAPSARNQRAQLIAKKLTKR